MTVLLLGFLCAISCFFTTVTTVMNHASSGAAAGKAIFGSLGAGVGGSCGLFGALAVEVMTDVEGECGADGAESADGSCVANVGVRLDEVDAVNTEAVNAEAAPDTMDNSVGEEEEEGPQCIDKEERCAGWAKVGECDNNPNYMLIYCPVSCNSCPEKYDLTTEEKDLLKAVAKYGEPQKVEGKEVSETLEIIRKTVSYMQNEVLSPNPTHHLSPDLISECINREELCAFWAAIGECEANSAYMKVKCAPSCRSCHMIDFDARCPPLGSEGEEVRPGFLPGELNEMFERIVRTAPGNRTGGESGETEDSLLAEGMTNYTVIVHSRPAPFEGGERIISRERDLEQPPWVITFENFLTEEECKKLIELGHESNYERSKDVGSLLKDGSYDSVESKSRTSENAWCSHRNKCRSDPTATRIHQRISTLTGLPTNHSEDLQLLKYEPGQFYRPHHDYIEHQRHRRCGPRVLTFFLYLTTVEEGGATYFPKLKIGVTPKAGRAVLWPSVLDSDPLEKDPRTDHEAQDVVRGTKFGANAWLHLHDYLAAQDMGCS